MACNQGDRGIWRGGVQGDAFVMSGPGGAIARIERMPNTQEIIEGKGVIAQGNSDDLACQAQFCGAINRGIINLSMPSGEIQYWGDVSKYFNMDTYNKYVWFFHQSDISYGGKTYAFAYDDTFDQSATLMTSSPEKVKITIGGFYVENTTKTEDVKTSNFVEIYPNLVRDFLYLNKDSAIISSIINNLGVLMLNLKAIALMLNH